MRLPFLIKPVSALLTTLTVEPFYRCGKCPRGKKRKVHIVRTSLNLCDVSARRVASSFCESILQPDTTGGIFYFFFKFQISWFRFLHPSGKGSKENAMKRRGLFRGNVMIG